MKWFKFPELRPEKEDWYIVALKNKSIDHGYYLNGAWDGCRCVMGNIHNKTVTHWMPIPSLPKDEE